jgi:hypothetical protein
MLTFSDARESHGYLRSPRIEPHEIRLLWHCDYWDGPISGMLVYRGEQCWFQVVAENETDDWFRRFVVIRLTPEQLADELRWHELFRQKVGLHTDYDEHGHRELDKSLHPREHWREFYDAYQHRTPHDFATNGVLGWFER